MMKEIPLKKLEVFSQSIWLDFILSILISSDVQIAKTVSHIINLT